MRQYSSFRERQLLLSRDQSAFYKHVNRVLGRSAYLNNCIDTTSHGDCSHDDGNLAKIFSQEFVKNFSQLVANDDLSLEKIISASSTASQFNITIDETFAALLSASNSAAGLDGVPGYVLKWLAVGLCLPLSIIFQQSVYTGIFTSCWKVATVVLFYKGKGDLSMPASYRPISLCSTSGKVLEKIVSNQLLQHIDLSAPLADCQHGFVKRRSTITNMLMTERVIAVALNKEACVDVLTFDFAKAFDKEPHSRLLRELASRGINGTALRWFKSFLSGRSQLVKIGQVLSPAVSITSGVIQGSSAGPILFTVFIDSLFQKIKLPAFAFADDVKLVGNLSSFDTATIQECVSMVYDWSCNMHMPPCLDKCAVVHYGANNINASYLCGDCSIPSVNLWVDLGVTRTSDTSYKDYVAVVAGKGRRLVGLCRYALSFRDADFLMRVYSTYIRPVLTYGSCIWSPHFRSEVKSLESVQRKFTKLVSGQQRSTYGQRLQSPNILSLESHRIELNMITVYKLLHGLMGITPEQAGLHMSSNNVRSGVVHLEQPCARTVRMQSLFMFSGPSLWNSLPFCFTRSASLVAFKNKLRDWLLNVDSIVFKQ